MPSSEMDKREELARVPEQCAEAHRLAGEMLPQVISAAGARQIVICGAGDSALAGDLAQTLAALQASVPILVARGYQLPRFVGPETLVIALSASGTTEEQVYAISEASDREARVLVITGGGHLQDIASAQGFPCLLLSPESAGSAFALGALFWALWGAFGRLQIVPETSEADREETFSLLRRQRDALASEITAERNPARQLAQALSGTVPLFYGSPGLAAVAHYWKAQCNRLARLPAFWNAAPDLAHDEAFVWSEDAPPDQPYSLVILRDRRDLPIIAEGIDNFQRCAAEANPTLPIHEIYADGRSALARLWSAVYLGDFVAAFLALDRPDGAML